MNGDLIEFVTKSGILTAKKVDGLNQSDVTNSCSNGAREVFSIELDFLVVAVGECDPKEIPSIPTTLNGLSMINVKKTTTAGDLIVRSISLLYHLITFACQMLGDTSFFQYHNGLYIRLFQFS